MQLLAFFGGCLMPSARVHCLHWRMPCTTKGAGHCWNHLWSAITGTRVLAVEMKASSKPPCWTLMGRFACLVYVAGLATSVQHLHNWL